jgi:hypothetical protein
MVPVCVCTVNIRINIGEVCSEDVARIMPAKEIEARDLRSTRLFSGSEPTYTPSSCPEIFSILMMMKYSHTYNKSFIQQI